MSDSLTVIVIAISTASASVILYFTVVSLIRRRERKSILKMLEQSRNRINAVRDGDGTIKNHHSIKELTDAEAPQKSEILRLLRESSTESRRLAVSQIRKFRMVSLSEDLCKCLNIPVLDNEAALALEEFGESAVQELVNFCNSMQGNNAACRSAIRLLGKAGNLESSSFLFTKLWDESREVSEEAAHALAGSDFFVSGEERHRLTTLIEGVTDCLAWDIAVKATFLKYNDQSLPGEIERDKKRWQNFLFSLLSIAHGSGIIDMIRNLLSEGGDRQIITAGRLIDNLVDPAIRQKVHLMLIPIPQKSILKKIGKLYPSAIIAYDELPEAIINRDYNQLDLWIKACTLRRLPEIRTPGMQESVSALLFSPEELMREESARLIARTNREYYWSVSERIADPFRRRLDRIVMGTVDKEDLLYEKVNFLTGKFRDIPAHELISLASCIVYAPEFGGAVPGEDCIIWPLNTGEIEAFIHYITPDASHDVRLPVKGEPCYFLSFSSLEEFRMHYPDRSGEINSYMGKHSN